jgi:hypothetical protein
VPGASKSPPPQFGLQPNSNITFYNTGGAVTPSNLMDGLNIETRAAFCITGLLNGTVGQKISYDIDIMIMSAPMQSLTGSLVTYPIITVVVDPAIIIGG